MYIGVTYYCNAYIRIVHVIHFSKLVHVLNMSWHIIKYVWYNIHFIHTCLNRRQYVWQNRYDILFTVTIPVSGIWEKSMHNIKTRYLWSFYLYMLATFHWKSYHSQYSNFILPHVATTHLQGPLDGLFLLLHAPTNTYIVVIVLRNPPKEILLNSPHTFTVDSV